MLKQSRDSLLRTAINPEKHTDGLVVHLSLLQRHLVPIIQTVLQDGENELWIRDSNLIVTSLLGRLYQQLSARAKLLKPQKIQVFSG